MNRCPITYQECGTEKYSEEGLRLLSPRLSELRDFPFSSEQQRREAVIRAAKMSIQGIQPKLSVRLSVRDGIFEIVDRGGRFVLKPQHDRFPQLPENEAVTMHMAGLAGIEVPVHGLVYCQDGALSYFIRRFDRLGRGEKVATEDFAQLSGMNRETKYESSMERLAELLDRYCTFPALEKQKLFQRCFFNYLVGNEDMHLKNFSVITRDGKIELAPAYDFLNTTIAYVAIGKPRGDIEEVALPLKGRKKRLTRSLWLDYFGGERLRLNERVVADALQEFKLALPAWHSLLSVCFLSDDQKRFYRELLDERCAVLGL
ncbi:MAG: HipA domain-containing protein [bacterium]